MSKELPIHRNVSKISNEIDFIDKILSIYSIVKYDTENKLREYEKNILIYYVRKDITDETLETVCEDRGIKKNYLHKINKDLRDKGYLVTSETNYRKFHLNDDLKNIRENFIIRKFKNYLVSFVN
jgi:hypothetical protein